VSNKSRNGAGCHNRAAKSDQDSYNPNALRHLEQPPDPTAPHTGRGGYALAPSVVTELELEPSDLFERCGR